jgi:broad specificity phosphatase PhoE
MPSSSHRGIVKAWQTRDPRELRFAIVRHAERADSSWESDWALSTDAETYPFDPPLTAAGLLEARAAGEKLRDLGPPAGDGWTAAISSPFFRCVQTAVEICNATGASLILDQDWGEVRFPEYFDTEAWNERQEVTRTYEFLANYVAQKGVKLRNEKGLRGKQVWSDCGPENLQQARERYARKFTVCLDRAMLSQSSFIVVSHGESLPGCVPLFPAYRGAEVARVPFCGMIVGRLEQPLAARKQRASPSDAYAASSVFDGLSVIENSCELRGIAGASLESKPSSLPAWARSEKLHFRSVMLRKRRGITDSDSLEYTLFRDMLLLSPKPDAEDRPSPVLENPAESDDAVLKDDEDFDPAGDVLVALPPPPMKREVSGASQMNFSSVGDSTILLAGSDVGSERESSVEAAIDVDPGSAGGYSNSFEMMGLFTDPTFKKLPSCRHATRWPTQSKGQSCSPMGCVRTGPFARVPSGSKGKLPLSVGCTTPETGNFSVRKKPSQTSTVSTKGYAPWAAPIPEREPTVRSPKEASPGAATISAAPVLTAPLPAAGSKDAPEDPVNLCAMEGNPLWKRRQFKVPLN